MRRRPINKPFVTDWMQLKEMDDRLTREKQASLRLELFRRESARAQVNGWKQPETA